MPLASTELEQAKRIADDMTTIERQILWELGDGEHGVYPISHIARDLRMYPWTVRKIVRRFFRDGLAQRGVLVMQDLSNRLAGSGYWRSPFGDLVLRQIPN